MGESPFEYDRVAMLECIKQSVERLRELAKVNPNKFGADALAIADQVAEDALKLETELIAAGYLKSANKA